MALDQTKLQFTCETEASSVVGANAVSPEGEALLVRQEGIALIFQSRQFIEFFDEPAAPAGRFQKVVP